jgi:hypothetical protein
MSETPLVLHFMLALEQMELSSPTLPRCEAICGHGDRCAKRAAFLATLKSGNKAHYCSSHFGAIWIRKEVLRFVRLKIEI